MAKVSPKTGTSPHLKGYSDMQRKLAALINGLPNEVAAALYTEAQVERTESMRRTPVDVGNLRASHIVTPPEIKGADITVKIAVGGPAAPYAIFVHENTEADHPVGQAKFLESTLKESAPHMAARVARRINLRQTLKGT